MNRTVKTEIVRAALAGSQTASATLREQSDDVSLAKEISERLLSVLPEKSDQVEAWLQTIVEKHPELAAPIGREFLQKMSNVNGGQGRIFAG